MRIKLNLNTRHTITTGAWKLVDKESFQILTFSPAGRRPSKQFREIRVIIDSKVDDIFAPKDRVTLIFKVPMHISHIVVSRTDISVYRIEKIFEIPDHDERYLSDLWDTFNVSHTDNQTIHILNHWFTHCAMYMERSIDFLYDHSDLNTLESLHIAHKCDINKNIDAYAEDIYEINEMPNGCIYCSNGVTYTRNLALTSRAICGSFRFAHHCNYTHKH